MFTRESPSSRPIHPIAPDALADWLGQASEQQRRWVEASGFAGEAGSHVVVPGSSGELDCVLVGHADGEYLWSLAHLPSVLPAGDYHLLAEWPAEGRQRAALGWGLACHRFDRYKAMSGPTTRLVVAPEDRPVLDTMLAASTHVRDLVNTPAIDLGPAELAEEARLLSELYGAECQVTSGQELEREFPAIHVVGQAASRPPCLIRMRWGRKGAPTLALVGKGVVFDSGGLNIKPGAGMVLMKKDMGGAAHVLGLARLIMALELPVDLRVYIPAVENAIAGNAYRPSDIIRTRNGTSVEIGNTDAEGRVVLSDALTLACEEGADCVIDFATLTGAARIALGEDLPPVYGRDGEAVRALQDLSFLVEDPVWQMPLYKPYKRQIQPALADLSNSGTTPQGGSLTAALFLEHFVKPDVDWYHLDVYAWNLADRPGRPAGGEAQGVRAVWEWLKTRYPA